MVSNAVRLSRAGLHAHTRPLGSFLFLGPTGTSFLLAFDHSFAVVPLVLLVLWLRMRG